MCILFVAMGQHPDYPLIIAANRDEFHERPTAPINWWHKDENAADVFAGKDLQAGGTWMGINKKGRFAALTNYRLIPQQSSGNEHSRGELVLSALNTEDSLLSEQLHTQRSQYLGYNLLFGDTRQLSCYDSVNDQFHHFTQGCFSLCNGPVHDIWPKMAKGEQALTRYVEETKSVEHKALFDLLNDRTEAPDHLLPSTGLPSDWERKLSAIFIVGEEYGTRSSCVLTINNQQQVIVTERTYNTSGEIINEAREHWHL